jgi:hypothetical protein
MLEREVGYFISPITSERRFDLHRGVFGGSIGEPNALML